MKAALLILFTSLYFTAVAQNGVLKKTWVTADHLLYAGTFDNIFFFETLTKKNIVINYGLSGGAMFNRFAAPYSLVKDTLRLSITSAPDDYADFLLDTTKKDRLNLTPLNGSAKQITAGITSGTDEKLIFHSIQHDHTDSIKFEKIIYKQVGGYHSAPAIIYEIGKDKKIRLYHEKDTRSFVHQLPKEVLDKMPPERIPIPEGYFMATLTDEMLKQLIDILKISEIDKLPATGRRNIDIPDHTIEIYYNHKIKHIYAGWLPVAADPLLEYLEGLPKKLTLVPSKNSFEIKFAEQN